MLFEITQPAIGTEFLGQFEIASEDAFHCGCYGDAWLHFFAGEAELAVIGFHHSLSLRWRNGPWNSDARLANGSGTDLSQWFATMGYSGFEEKRLSAIAETEKRELLSRTFWEQLDPGMRATISAAETLFRREQFVAKRILTDAPDPTAVLVGIFRAFGQRPLDTLSYDSVSSLARTVVEQASADDLLNSLKVIEADVAGKNGAALLFCEFPFHRKLDSNSADYWAAKLGELVLASENDSRKADAIRRMTDTPGGQVDEMLLSIAEARRTFSYVAHLNRDQYDQEPELLASVCLALAIRGHPRAAEAIAAHRQTLDDFGKAAIHVAECLVSKTIALDPSVFKIQSSLIGFGALKLLEDAAPDQVPARLIGAAMDAPWGAVRSAATKLGAKLGVGPVKEIEEHNFDEVNFDDSLADSAPQIGVSEYTAALVRAKGITKGRLLQLRGHAFLNLGRNDEALKDYEAAKEFDRRTNRSDKAKALWRSGRVKEAVQELSWKLPLSDPWELTLRGTAYFAEEKFSDAERDFAAASTVDPRNSQAIIFQHISAHLSANQQMSRLNAPNEYRFVHDDFDQALEEYFLGRIEDTQLMDRAAEAEFAMLTRARAWFFRSQLARMNGDSVVEQANLRECVALEQFQADEHWLALARLARLKSATN